MQISGKTVVITGGGRGIGRELAKAFAAKGGRIAALDLNLQKLAEQILREEVQKLDAVSDTQQLDLTQEVTTGGIRNRFIGGVELRRIWTNNGNAPTDNAKG